MVNKKRREGFPKLKKKVSSFLSGEEGKISKSSLLKVGGVLTAISSASFISAGTSKTNKITELSYNSDTGTAVAKHGNHANHSSHSSHSSY